MCLTQPVEHEADQTRCLLLLGAKNKSRVDLSACARAFPVKEKARDRECKGAARCPSPPLNVLVFGPYQCKQAHETIA